MADSTHLAIAHRNQIVLVNVVQLLHRMLRDWHVGGCRRRCRRGLGLLVLLFRLLLLLVRFLLLLLGLLQLLWLLGFLPF